MPHSRSFDITSSDANPSTATTLSREKCPRATRNRDLATPSVSASSSSSAALAFPSWGGAVTLTRSVPSRIPSTRSRDARGCTRTLIVQPSVASKDTPLSAKAAKSSIV